MQPVKELKAAVGSIVAPDRGPLLAVEQNKCLVPPLFHRYVAWGFTDLSLRVGDVHTDRTVPGMIYEMLSCGEVLCAACPTDKILITGGTCSVVHVWEFGELFYDLACTIHLTIINKFSSKLPFNQHWFLKFS